MRDGHRGRGSGHVAVALVAAGGIGRVGHVNAAAGALAGAWGVGGLLAPLLGMPEHGVPVEVLPAEVDVVLVVVLDAVAGVVGLLLGKVSDLA